MYPLASQSSIASAHQVEARSVARTVAPAQPALHAGAANDNSAAWKPSLLVQRRRRSARRAIHY